ncbi:SIS domain-containing protein [Marinilactibacillus psychrotolerans]|uniref:Arabinose 5-phosphate isomerase n=1 Tax=Marinilactibacillus psychrotolerans TaxID=191770 RepID=A0AAV3WRW2_9LACT|nr:SIS domain-containing protein [Marinilactibacillus psychrotolerans]GEL67611.1 carbohydrate isomerase [Marinilactibacillus psychrotolerans]GEQ35505.1 arabinose 5-phosphate isomerase [Marinilactibacillus psychrotolerans]SDD07535.1 arabinose-5-phosphate isomerase [Marinilactibacillus psychrotolerans]
MLQKFIDTVDSEVNKLLYDSLPVSALKYAAKLIQSAEKKGNRVHVMGIGKPSYVAGYCASLLSSTGTPAYELDGTEAVHGSSGQVIPGDIVIAISNSGETKELLYSVETVKCNGAKVIGLSKNIRTSLSRLSEVALVSEVMNEGDDLNKPPRASILNQLIILQCLSVLLQEAKELDMEGYLKWHPGGTIGENRIGKEGV